MVCDFMSQLWGNKIDTWYLGILVYIEQTDVRVANSDPTVLAVGRAENRDLT